MIDWWNSLGLTSQILYCIAIPSTLVLAIQTLLMFFGFGSGADGDVDIDTSDANLLDGIFGDNSVEVADDLPDFQSLHIFSVRGVIAFFVIFGWVGLVMQSFGANLPLTLIVSMISGLAMMVLIAYLFRAMMRLKSNGNEDNRNAVGTAGKVYLTIPSSRSGEGKVTVMLGGAYVERNAVTDEKEAIPTGCEVIVVGTSGQTTLVVKRK